MITTERVDYDENLTTDFNGAPVEETHHFTNDIAFAAIPGSDKLDISLVSGKEAVRNVVEAVVNTYRGELPMDTTKGIPYFEDVLGNVDRRLLADWEMYFREAVLNTNGVDGIASFEYEVEQDGNRRNLAYTVGMKTSDGVVEVSNTQASTGVVSIPYNNITGV